MYKYSTYAELSKFIIKSSITAYYLLFLIKINIQLVVKCTSIKLKKYIVNCIS